MHRALRTLETDKDNAPSRPLAEYRRHTRSTNKRNVLRHEAQMLRTSDTWGAFREVRSLLWSKIKQARKLFIDRALSSTRPKEIWQTVYRILNPSPQPLRLDVDELNNFFASTAERTTGNSEVDIKEDLINFVQSLHPTTSNHDLLKLRVVTVAEVLREIKVIRTDASTGHDLTSFQQSTRNLLLSTLSVHSHTS